MGAGSSGIPLQQQRYLSPDSSSSEIIHNISIGSIIGKGGYSKVFFGKHSQTKVDLAIKRINLQPKNNLTINSDSDPLLFASRIEEEEQKIRPIFQELDAMKRIQSHHFIVNLHSAFHYKTSCYFILDYCSGDLRQFLRMNGPCTEECVLYLVQCLGSALAHIHSRGVIHRDIKPENILLTSSGRPYLSDFGISVTSSFDNPLPLCDTSSGTLGYMAPEVLVTGNLHSYQSDYWSLGVMAYELLYGSRPFRHHCPVEMIKFVSRQYEWLWKQLKQETQQHQQTPRTLLLTSPVINFEDLRPPINWIPSASSASSHEFNEDGTVPSSLILQIPQYRCANYSDPSSDPVPISDDCQNLLRGLLDIRFPHRLGSRIRYAEFMEHQAFRRYNYSHSHLSQTPSPLSLEYYAYPTYSNNPQLSSLVDFERMELASSSSDTDCHMSTLSPFLQTKLSEFSYSNPNMRHGRRSSSSVLREKEKMTSRLTTLTARSNSRVLGSAP
jgi:serine/threonine protein kinase